VNSEGSDNQREEEKDVQLAPPVFENLSLEDPDKEET